jgi:hypothetical protein
MQSRWFAIYPIPISLFSITSIQNSLSMELIIGKFPFIKFDFALFGILLSENFDISATSMIPEPFLPPPFVNSSFWIDVYPSTFSYELTLRIIDSFAEMEPFIIKMY